MIKNIISRLMMVKSGGSFYDFIGKEVIYYWTDCYFDRYAAKSRFGTRIKVN